MSDAQSSRDQRAHPRLAAMRRGILIHSVTGACLKCTVVDVSDGGAQLELSCELPDGLISLLDPEAGTTHDLKIVWRDGRRIGVSFVASSELP